MSTGLTIEQQKSIVSKWRASPIVRHYSFFNDRLWDKQEEVLWATRNHKRVCVKSGNTVGKTKVAADIVNDWLFTRGPKAKVITTSSSWNQVEQVLWKEIKSSVANAKIPLGAEVLNTSLKLSDDWFAIGISTDTPVRFQGFHSPNLLVLADEASGISAEIWEMFEALHPACIVALGNPLEPSGKFYEAFQSDMWHKITISCWDAVNWQEKHGAIPGLVTREWCKDMEELHGKGSAWYQSHVLGEFPEEGEGSLISREWVNRARKGVDCDGLEIDEENEDAKVRIISADIATKHGNNETVIGYRYGHTISEMKAYLQATQTFARDQISSKYTAKEVHICVTDSDGVGESMAELLAESHIPCEEFHGGYAAKAMDGNFRNLRSQFYYLVAKKFEKGLYDLRKLDDKAFDILRSQLCSIKVKVPDGMGRFQIETKEDMLARGIKSPDYADCFMMSEYGYFMRKHAELRPRRYGVL